MVKVYGLLGERMARRAGALVVVAGLMLAGSGAAQPQAKDPAARPLRVEAARSAPACDAALDPLAVSRLAQLIVEGLRAAPASAPQSALEAGIEEVIAVAGAAPPVVQAALAQVLNSELTVVQRAAVEEVRKRVAAVAPPCAGPTAGSGRVGAAPLSPPPGGQGGGGTDYTPPRQ